MCNLENEKQKLLLYWKANCASLVMKTTVTVAAAAAVVAAVAVEAAAVPATLLAIQVLEQD